MTLLTDRSRVLIKNLIIIFILENGKFEMEMENGFDFIANIQYK